MTTIRTNTMCNTFTRPTIPYTDHYDLLAWVRDVNNTDFVTPDGVDAKHCVQYWEVDGKLFNCVGNAVYHAGGRPAKVMEFVMVIEDPITVDGKTYTREGTLYPPNWLDRPAVAVR